MNLHLKFSGGLMLAVLVLCAGCDSEITGWEGIYELQSWTDNQSGCDSEGMSILEMQSDDHFYVKAENLLGQEFLNVAFCEGLDACTALAAGDTINLEYGLDQGGDQTGWIGSGYTLGGSTTCSGEVRHTRLVETAPSELHFEIRRTFVDNVPLDTEGFCDSDAALEMADAQGCEGIEQVTAMQVSDL